MKVLIEGSAQSSKIIGYALVGELTCENLYTNAALVLNHKSVLRSVGRSTFCSYSIQYIYNFPIVVRYTTPKYLI
jgi:hypothetical protein